MHAEHIPVRPHGPDPGAEGADGRPGEPVGQTSVGQTSVGQTGDGQASDGRAADRRARRRSGGRRAVRRARDVASADLERGGPRGDRPGAGDRAGDLGGDRVSGVGGAVAPDQPGTRWGALLARWRRRSGRVRAVQVVVLVGLLFVGYYLVTLAQVWSTGRADEARPVDAIVVLGAAQYDGRPSPQLAARLDHAVRLWPDGIAPTVIVTGGNQPGDRFTEAEASARYLTDRGIPAASIVLEGSGSTTYESMELVAELLAGEGDRVLIVTDPYHALRSRLIAEELGLSAYVSPTDTSVVTGGESVRRHVQEAAGVAVGRVIGFGRLSRLTD